MSFSQYLRQMGQAIAYYPKLAKPLGGATSAVLFSQLFYWQDKTANPLGVFKSQEDLERETGLTRREQETARKNLRELGILIETHKRLEHRLYFKIDEAKLDELMDNIRQSEKETSTNGENVQPPMAENAIREVTNPPFVISKITSKTTSKTTAKITNNNIPPTPNGESADAEHESQPLAENKSLPKNKNLSVDYTGIVDEFNDCVDDTPISQVRVLSNKRRRQILSLAKLLNQQFGTCDVKTFRNYFNDFLRQVSARKDRFYFGGGKTGWVANFDYVMRADTFTKTLEDSL
ncbi:DNA replication protein [Lonepinella koalarum]|uniref:DNA replication protein n=1 Tax=Lonepinella koalarum TaxID=53417 RepID=UPI003F6DF65A